MNDYNRYLEDEDQNEEYLMDDVMLQKLKSDEKYREFFKNNLDILLAYNELVEPSFVIKLIEEVPDFKAYVLDNLNRILPKVIHRDELYKTLSKQELERYGSILFVPSACSKRISYGAIIRILTNKKFSEEEMKNFVADNMAYIIESSGYHLPADISTITKLFGDENPDSDRIKKIDEALASHIDIIMKNDYKGDGFNYNDFEKYKRFKKRAQEINELEFLLKFPVSRNMTIKQCKEMCDELYHSFEGISLAAMKLAKGDETSAVVYGTIINELVCATNENRKIESKNTGELVEEVKVEDFSEVGHGSFSKVYKIGDFVLKVDIQNRSGIKRVNPVIKNHPRILQPLIRGIIDDGKDSRYIEVQNLIDTNWYENMTDDEIEEVLYTIYSELRDSGLVWNDIKKNNVGKLLKPNKSNLTFIDIDGERKEIRPVKNATGLVGEIPDDKVLQAGELVISDTDFIFPEADIDKYRLSAITEEYEQRYQKEKEKRKKESNTKDLSDENSQLDIEKW